MKYLNSIDIPITDFCNLKCPQCVAKAKNYTVREYVNPSNVGFFRDLNIISKYYQFKIIRIVGGEPLLHPYLFDIISKIKQIKFGGKLHLTTNGIMLDKIDIRVLKLFDVIDFSQYPNVNESSIEKFKELNIKYDIRDKSEFFELYTGATDGSGFYGCKLSHEWGCLMYKNGYMFRCSATPYILDEARINYDIDAVKVTDNDFFQLFEMKLKQETPFESCKNCNGTHKLIKNDNN